MRSFCLLFFLLLAVPQLLHGQSIHLFNGHNLNGWYAYQEMSGKHANATDIFSVDDHMIRLYGPKAGYLMSTQSFHDFQLTAEFRWNTDTTFVRKQDQKNSGLMYLVPSDTPDTLWPKGIQFQIKESATGDFILLHDVTLQVNGEKIGPGASVVSERFTNAANPIGKWNTLVVTCKGNKIIQKLNGTLVNKGENPSVSGDRILLQYEGFPIDFRKVEVEKL